MSQQKPLQYVVKDAEPVYVATDDDFSGPHGTSDDPRFQLRADFIEKTKGVPAARGKWHCAYCWMEFSAKKSCQKHMGLVPNMPAYCRVLLELDEARRGRFLIVTLTLAEYLEAMAEADRRMDIDDEFAGEGENPAPPEVRRRDMKIGCLCERAYFKWKGLPWALACRTLSELRRGSRRPADYGDHEVRGMQKGGHMLLVQQGQPIEYVYICASAALEDLVVTFHGWANGVDVKQEKYLADHFGKGRKPCYGVHMSKLQPMRTLPEPKLK